MARRKQVNKNESASSRSTAAIFQNIENAEQLEETTSPRTTKHEELSQAPEPETQEEVKFPLSVLYEFQDFLNLHMNFRKGVEVLTCLYYCQISYLYLEKDFAAVSAIGFNILGALLAMYLSHRSLVKKYNADPENTVYPALPEFNTIYAFLIPISFSILLGDTTSPFFQMNLALNNFCVKSLHPVAKVLSSFVFYYMYNENETLELFEFVRAVWLYFSLEMALTTWNEHREDDEDDTVKTTLSATEIHIICVFIVNLLCNFHVELNDTTIVLYIIRALMISLIVAFGISYPLYYGTRYLSGGALFELASFGVIGAFAASFYYTMNYLFRTQTIDVEVISWLINYITSSEMRVKLLASWVLLLVIAIPVMFLMSSKKVISLNLSRKAWHFMLTGAISYPAMTQEPVFVAIAVSGSVFVFIAIEAVRCTRLTFLGKFLHSQLAHFQDEKDTKGPLNLSYIFLLIGVAIPIVYGALIEDLVSLRSYIGVVALGLSDSMASIVGSKFGKQKWKGGNRTLEGTLTYLVVFLASYGVIDSFILQKEGTNWENIFIVALSGAVLEGAATLNDNVLIPCMCLIMYELLNATF
ncbi:putative integral membrane protein [Clavispora lusitaniae]|uniref:putative integral membrane protein n=1 Tax=Clavispora lusitaniae TaxID=36911 RepID=UPI00202BFD0B|nr:putative integral membrane protein [Clavispora lusitaniae]